MRTKKQEEHSQALHQHSMERFYQSCPNPCCMVCGTPITEPTKQQRDKWFERHTIYCSRQCSKEAQRRGVVEASEQDFQSLFPQGAECTWCHKKLPKTTLTMRATYRKKKRLYCSETCSRKAKSMSTQTQRANPERYQQTLVKTGRAKARAFVERNLRIHPYQQTLHQHLGGELEYVVPLSKSYAQLDLAFPSLKLAVEIDEPAHRNQQRRRIDEPRDLELNQLGWSVLRFYDELEVSLIESIVSLWLAPTTSSLTIS